MLPRRQFPERVLASQVRFYVLDGQALRLIPAVCGGHPRGRSGVLPVQGIMCPQARHFLPNAEAIPNVAMFAVPRATARLALAAALVVHLLQSRQPVSTLRAISAPLFRPFFSFEC
jgi:hypothetical protein